MLELHQMMIIPRATRIMIQKTALICLGELLNWLSLLEILLSFWWNSGSFKFSGISLFILSDYLLYSSAFFISFSLIYLSSSSWILLYSTFLASSWIAFYFSSAAFLSLSCFYCSFFLSYYSSILFLSSCSSFYLYSWSFLYYSWSFLYSSSLLCSRICLSLYYCYLCCCSSSLNFSSAYLALCDKEGCT